MHGLYIQTPLHNGIYVKYATTCPYTFARRFVPTYIYITPYVGIFRNYISTPEQVGVHRSHQHRFSLCARWQFRDLESRKLLAAYGIFSSNTAEVKIVTFLFLEDYQDDRPGNIIGAKWPESNSTGIPMGNYTRDRWTSISLSCILRSVFRGQYL